MSPGYSLPVLMYIRLALVSSHKLKIQQPLALHSFLFRWLAWSLVLIVKRPSSRWLPLRSSTRTSAKSRGLLLSLSVHLCWKWWSCDSCTPSPCSPSLSAPSSARRGALLCTSPSRDSRSTCERFAHRGEWCQWRPTFDMQNNETVEISESFTAGSLVCLLPLRDGGSFVGAKSSDVRGACIFLYFIMVWQRQIKLHVQTGHYHAYGKANWPSQSIN